MGKIKIIFAIVVIYFIYKGFTAIMDFDLAVTVQKRFKKLKKLQILKKKVQL